MYGSLPVSSFCEDSYIGITSRQFGKRIKEHILKCIDKLCKTSKKENKSK